MEQFLTIIGGLIGLVVLIYFFSTCHDIEAIRKKIAPTPKQMLKEAKIEFKIGNRDVRRANCETRPGDRWRKKLFGQESTATD